MVDWATGWGGRKESLLTMLPLGGPGPKVSHCLLIHRQAGREQFERPKHPLRFYQAELAEAAGHTVHRSRATPPGLFEPQNRVEWEVEGHLRGVGRLVAGAGRYGVG